ncbi:MAG: hypothetical protein M1816_004017 [Peltula sp. TS41687]|nr:MAG: hypothetical protein M1816_004017 [Peltula sp. TS41687]
MSAPGSAPLGPPGPPGPCRGGTATPALPSAPRRVYCLRGVKWLGTVPNHVCLQKANGTRCDRCSKNGSACLKIPPRFRTVVAKIQAGARALPGLPTARRTPAKNALVIATATLGSRVDKHNRHMKKESGDRKSLSLVEEHHAFPEISPGPGRFARIGLPTAVGPPPPPSRIRHGQLPAFLDADDSGDEEDDGGDDDGDGGGNGMELVLLVLVQVAPRSRGGVCFFFLLM